MYQFLLLLISAIVHFSLNMGFFRNMCLQLTTVGVRILTTLLFQEHDGNVYPLTDESEVSSLHESEIITLKASYDKVSC